MSKFNVRTPLDNNTKLAFRSAAKKRGTSEARLLQLLIGAFLKYDDADDNDNLPPTETKNGKFTFRLSEKLKGDLAHRAKKSRMTPGSYLVALCCAHLRKGPFFTELEMDVLRQSNYELSAIGRNINQIARALNRSIDHADLARAKEIEQMAALIRQHRDFVRGLIIANQRAWGTEHGNTA